jgi:hypothetical protein
MFRNGYKDTKEGQGCDHDRQIYVVLEVLRAFNTTALEI